MYGGAVEPLFILFVHRWALYSSFLFYCWIGRKVPLNSSVWCNFVCYVIGNRYFQRNTRRGDTQGQRRKLIKIERFNDKDGRRG
ncbi:hypothetical protein LguiA_022245 [Lonicera macranthoides]